LYDLEGSPIVVDVDITNAGAQGTFSPLTEITNTTKQIPSTSNEMIATVDITSLKTIGIVGIEGRSKAKKLSQKKTNKILRNSGKLYTSSTSKVIPERNMKVGCEETCYKKCYTKFSDLERANIFAEYYKLSYIQKKDFVLKHVEKKDKQRSTVVNNSRRKFTRTYYLPKENGDRVVVCRHFFVSTLDIKPKFLRYTENNFNTINCAKDDKRGSATTPKNRTSPRSLKMARIWIESLPAVFGHYCRNSTQKKYLPENFENLANVYRLYTVHCKENNYVPMSKYIFNNIFRKEYNIGFHTPKKDKCTVCIKFESSTDLSEEDIIHKTEHDVEKNGILANYAADQHRSNTEKTFLTTSFDLQKVLNVPHGKSMLFYYAKKYAVYNLTFYESFTRNGLCYMWGECDGKRGSNEICSIMFKYLTLVDERKTIKEVALYCDNCAGQQKNRAMILTIMYFLE